MGRHLGVLVTLTVLACAPNTAETGSGGRAGEGVSPLPGVSLRAEDRVVIPSMTVVLGVAISARYVFIATPGALGVFDRQFSAWLPPLTLIDGWPNVAVAAMLADPADPAAVWFGADNVVYHYRVGFDDIMRVVVPGRVTPGAFFIESANPSSGVVVGGGPTGYMRVSATGFAEPYTPSPAGARVAPGARARIEPQTVASVYAQYRNLQGFERLLTRDDAMRTWPVVSAASSPTNSEVWLGTGGGGVFKVDPLFGRGVQVPFGLIADGAGAVARAADGVWFGSLGNGLGPRGGLTFTDDALHEWRWIDGGTASPLNAAKVTAISSWASSLWVASDHGLVQLDGRSGTIIRRWDDLSGLPSPIALAVAATADGAWVGTARGLVFVHDAQRASRAGRPADVDPPVLTGNAVRALARRGDTLWIATDAGLMVLTPGAEQARRVVAAVPDMRLNAPVSAITTADSVVIIAIATGEVLRIHTRTGEVLDAVSYVNSRSVAGVNALAIDATTLWIAGQRGVLAMNRITRAQRFLAAGPDVPGEAYGIVLTPQYAWIAARGGAVRLRRVTDGMPR